MGCAHLHVITTERQDLTTLRAKEKMPKADLVGQVADAIGRRVTRKECGLVIDAFLAAVREALARGDGIELQGFGTFKVRHRKARTARNPRTGEPVEVSARGVPVFQPSRHLRSRVDRGQFRRGRETRGGSRQGYSRPTRTTQRPAVPRTDTQRAI